MRYFLLLIFATLPLFSAEEDLIKQLADDNYDIREMATDKLGNTVASNIEKFLLMAIDEKDAEVQMRLRSAARLIYERSVLRTENSWRDLHGTLDYEGQVRYSIKEQEPPDRPPENIVEGAMEKIKEYYQREYVEEGICVDWIPEGSPLEGKLERWDMIEKIDDRGLYETAFRADKEYELTVRRYKEPEKMYTNENDCYVDKSNKDYEVLKIKIKAGWKSDEKVDQQKAHELREFLWREHLNTLGRKNDKLAKKQDN